METAKMAYRLINNEAPNYISSFVERLFQNAIMELRNTKTDLKLPLLKTPSFCYRGARLWNNLSVDVKNVQNPKQVQKDF